MRCEIDTETTWTKSTCSYDDTRNVSWVCMIWLYKFWKVRNFWQYVGYFLHKNLPNMVKLFIRCIWPWLETDTADCLASSQQYLFDIRLLLYVQSLTPDNWRKDRPKRVECYSNQINLIHWCTWLVLLYLFDICLLLYVQSLTPDDGRKDRPKHVQCYSNKINLIHWCTWLVLL